MSRYFNKIIHLVVIGITMILTYSKQSNAQISFVESIMPLDGIEFDSKNYQKRLELPNSRAEYLNNPAPEYPKESKKLGEQGKVILKILVNKLGLPQKIEIVKSSGFIRLDESAFKSVEKWTFIPGRRNGVVEDMWVQIPIQYTLESTIDQIKKP
jgi:TonB family protein